jgi:hypothetical protein
MASSGRRNDLGDSVINTDLLRYSEYDIEVSDNDDGGIAEVKDARKLVIDPTYVGNSIEFKKNKNTLLVLPVKDIEDLDTTSDFQTNSGKDSHIEITFNDNQRNKSIKFKAKNDKYIDMIVRQIHLLKDAEGDPSIQKKIKSILNPELCNKCMKDKFVFEFHSSGNLCSNCFEEQYGKKLL